MIRITVNWDAARALVSNATAWADEHLLQTIAVFLVGAACTLAFIQKPVTQVVERIIVDDVATINDLEMGNRILQDARDRLAAKLKDAERKYLSVTEELAARTADGENAFRVLGQSMSAAEMSRHTLALRKQNGDWAGDFRGIYVTAFYNLAESMGVSKSFFQRNMLNVLKDALFAEGAAALQALWEHPLGRMAILSVAGSYKQELQVFNKYPQVLEAYNPEKIKALFDVDYRGRKDAIENIYDISGVTDSEAGNINFVIQFLDRRYRERVAGQESVDTILAIAREVMEELYPVPQPQQLGIKPLPISLRF